MLTAGAGEETPEPTASEASTDRQKTRLVTEYHRQKTLVEEPEPGGGAEGGAEAGGGAGLAKPKFIRVTTLEDVQVGSFNYHIVRF